MRASALSPEASKFSLAATFFDRAASKLSRYEQIC
jgi:hypothetical protein